MRHMRQRVSTASQAASFPVFLFKATIFLFCHCPETALIRDQVTHIGREDVKLIRGLVLILLKNVSWSRCGSVGMGPLG